MAEFVEVMKQKERMCNAMRCENCVLASGNNNTGDSCNYFVIGYPKQAEKIIMNWAKEHPVKTNADKFKEVFGYDLAKNLGYHNCAWLRCEDCDRKCESCECCGFWEKEYKEP